MISSWAYAVMFYLIPLMAILSGELWAVYAHDPNKPTITHLLTHALPESLLLALTAFGAVWAWVHWKSTYRDDGKKQ